MAFFLTALAGAACSNSLCAIGATGLFAALAAELLWARGAADIRLPHWPLLLALIASLTVSLFLSDFFEVSVRGLAKYLESFVLIYGGLNVVKDRRSLKIALGALLAFGAIAAFDGILQNFTGRDLRGRTAIPYFGDILRITGPFKHSNDYATFLVPCFALWMGALADAARLRSAAKTALSAACLAALSFAILRSMSRSALVGVFACVAVFALFFKHRALIFSALAAALALVYFVPSNVSVRLHELFNWSSGNMPERMILLKTTAAMVAANPWFGLGLNTYSDHFARFRPSNYHDVMYAHNSFLQMASETGLIGLALYLGFIGAFLLDLWKRVRRASDPGLVIWGAAVFSAAAGYLVNAAFESCLQSTQLRTLFWCVMGIAAGMAHRVLTTPATAPQPEKAPK